MLNEGISTDRTIGSFIGFLCFIVIPLISILTYAFRRSLRNKKSISTLFEEFKSQKYSQLLYYPLFFLRRFIYVSGFFVLKEYPLVQVIVNLSFSFITVCYLVIVKPFKNAIHTLVSFINEIFLGVLFGVTGSCLLDLSEDTLELLTKVVVISTGSIIMLNGALFIIVSCRGCRKKKNRRTHAIEMQISTEEKKDFTVIGETRSPQVAVETEEQHQERKSYFKR